MRHVEFYRRAKGYRRKQEQEWHRSRIMAAAIINSQRPRDKAIKVSDIVELSIDNDQRTFDDETLEKLRNFMPFQK